MILGIMPIADQREDQEETVVEEDDHVQHIHIDHTTMIDTNMWPMIVITVHIVRTVTIVQRIIIVIAITTRPGHLDLDRGTLHRIITKKL